MRLWFETLRVVLRRIVPRGPVKVLWPKRWLAGEVEVIRDSRTAQPPPEPSPRPPSDAGATEGDGRSRVFLRVIVGPAWARRGVRPLCPARWVPRGSSTRGEGRGSGCLLARRNEVMELSVRVDQLESRLDALEHTRVAEHLVEGAGCRRN